MVKPKIIITTSLILAIIIIAGVEINSIINKDYTTIKRDGSVLARYRWYIGAERTSFLLDSWYDSNIKCPKIEKIGGYRTEKTCRYPSDYYESLSRSLLNTLIYNESDTIKRITPYYKYGSAGSYAGVLTETSKYGVAKDEEDFPTSYVTDWVPKDNRNYRLILRLWDLKEQPLPNGNYTDCVYKSKNMKIDLKEECINLDYVNVYEDTITIFFKNFRGNQKLDVDVVDPSIELVVTTIGGIVFCYQETANESSILDDSCNLDYSGVYSIVNESAWFEPYNIFDGNWSTPGYTTKEDQYIFINYTKPENSTNLSKWQVEAAATGFEVNLSINGSCWDSYADILSLRLSGTMGLTTYWDCYNLEGDNWINLYYTVGGSRSFVEEAMFWFVNSTSTFNYKINYDLNPSLVSLAYSPNWSLFDGDINVSGNFTRTLTEYNITQNITLPYLYNVSNTGNNSVNVWLAVNNTESWFKTHCYNSTDWLDITTTNTSFIALAVGESFLFNCTLDLINATIIVTDWNETTNNVSWDFDYLFGITSG